MKAKLHEKRAKMTSSLAQSVPSLETIQAFFDDYRAVRGASIAPVETDTFVAQFSRLRDEYLQIKSESQQRQLSEAPQYNIFNILGVTRAEVRTHSAFLCHLLHPGESHGQGTLFLRTFLEHCARRAPEHFPAMPQLDEPGKWVAFAELHSQLGRMDIVIQNLQAGFICVIENKVDASEGFAQLERYGKWLEQNKKKYPYSVLCFLTVDGSLSLTAGEYPYIRLSYRRDIAEWLEDAMPKIQSEGVKAVVHQYQAVARNL
jgi:hypothetical protein